MSKKRRAGRSTPEDHFDVGRLTSEHHELLAAFQRRREAYDRALADSNVIYHKHTCPACGFPTLDGRGEYEVCVVCLWEDDGNERDPTRIAPPNYIALLQLRIDVAGMLEAVERTDELPDSLPAVIQGIREFKARLRRGEVAVDRQDFGVNLRNILPTRPRT